jgi:RecJ-like exonuclease
MLGSIECPCCDGTGEIEVEIPKPHAGGFNLGYIDSGWEECPECRGSGTVEQEQEDE